MVTKLNAFQTTNTSNLIKTTSSNTKINEIEKKTTDHDHGKYVATKEFNKLTENNFAARSKQRNLASKNDIPDIVKKINFDKKIVNINKKVTSDITKIDSK